MFDQVKENFKIVMNNILEEKSDVLVFEKSPFAGADILVNTYFKKAKA